MLVGNNTVAKPFQLKVSNRKLIMNVLKKGGAFSIADISLRNRSVCCFWVRVSRMAVRSCTENRRLGCWPAFMFAIDPYLAHIPASEARFYPLYAKCCELGIPVFITMAPPSSRTVLL